MAGAFESVARVALKEIIQAHAKESRFGMILTHDGFEELADALYEFLVTSRSLKTLGDKVIGGTADLPGTRKAKALQP